MLRTEIDWERANLLQLTHCYRDALKEALTGSVVRHVHRDGAAARDLPGVGFGRGERRMTAIDGGSEHG